MKYFSNLFDINVFQVYKDLQTAVWEMLGFKEECMRLGMGTGELRS